MINEQKKLNNLLKWCEHMREKHEIRFQPNNPPVDVILDEIMGDIQDLKRKLTLVADCLSAYLHRLELVESSLSKPLTAKDKKVKKNEE